MSNRFNILLLGLMVIGCGDDPLPKPKAELRLDFPDPIYKVTKYDLPFKFERNTISKPIESIKFDKNTGTYGIDINYPALKGTVYLTYRKIDGDLTELLRDAQNITQKHVTKADEIIEQIFENDSLRTYGMFYEVGGNAASQSQFYLTDSLTHFLNGSLYFYAKPNFDSIYPAAVYLKNDIKHLMESVEWNTEQ